MKIVFSLFVGLHALIHLAGFAKAFDLFKLSEFSARIDKFSGVLWLVAGVLLLSGGLSYLMNIQIKNWLLLAGVLLSQYLIILFWTDARFGTIMNLIILIVVIRALAGTHFESMVSKDIVAIHAAEKIERNQAVTESDCEHLPLPVQKWLHRSGVIGQSKTTMLRLKQQGRMRMKPNGKWMSFTAEQYFNTIAANFVWYTRVQSFAGVELLGRDKLKEGEGHMLIKLMGLIPLVNNAPNPQIDNDSMIRYLAEICWFPSAALSEQIHWISIDSSSAEATFTVNEKQVKGIFEFSDEGDFVSFRGMRHFSVGKDTMPENWLVRTIETKEMGRIRIPARTEVIWKLESGDFKWLELEIIEIDRSTSAPYPRHFH